MTASPRLFAVGGAHIDRRGRVTGRHIPAASNPGRMREEVGGGVFNAARLIARRGIGVSLLSLRGGDAAGAAVSEAIERAGIEDLSATFLDRATPSYTAILDGDGELVTGLADMELYEIAFAKQMRRRKCRDAAAGADAIICDANMPEAAIEALVAAAGTVPVHAIAISPAKAGRFVSSFSRLSALFMNRREALKLAGLGEDGAISEAAARLQALGLKAGVVTAGSRSVLAFSSGRLGEIVPPEVADVADVTGAGDALAGATVAALMRDRPLFEAVREGVAAAVLTVAQTAAVPEFDDNAFEAALRRVPQARVLSSQEF